MQKLIITVAPTGNVPTRQMNANLPITPEEIAEDVERCRDAGASIFHIHARDSQQKPTLDTAVFSEIVKNIKHRAPEVIIQLSTGGRAGWDWEARMNPVRLLPEMGSFTTGSNNMPGIIYENSPKFIEQLASVYKETGVIPEMEIFEAGMINNAMYLQKKYSLKTPLHFNFVLGVKGSLPASVKNLLFLSESVPAGSTWTVTGVASAQIPLAAASIIMGGHVRVGLEDNLMMPDGSASSNVLLVEKVVAIACEVGREIASPNEAREILSLNPDRKDLILKAIQ